MQENGHRPLAIEVNNLTRRYDDVEALKSVSFAVMPGEIFGFLGPNGAGKTTTIKILTGQLRPTAGTARVCGYDVVDERALLKPAIGVVFEHQNLYERMSGLDNLRFMARLYGLPRSRVDKLLAEVGLRDQARKSVSAYSNGMKQRLLIARALLHQPRVLFLDEPTKGLDPGVARDIRSLVADLAREGMTVFLTTHYMEEADRLCDRVAILDQGRIIALDAPDSLKREADREDVSLEDVFLALTGRSLIR